ncbi:MAG: hypothetical protein GX231_04685 [Tissierellia bacterium]|nr:hypothetical protein [Tissierellia bacterium]
MKGKPIFMLLLVSILLIGCTKQNSIDESEEKPVEEISIAVTGSDNEIIERSETISDIVVELYGIDDATTIILNDRAIIGVKVSDDQELTKETLEIIEEKVLGYDNKIADLLITDEDRIFADISDVIYDLLQGKSYDSQVKRINNIMNKIK